ncbi:class I SAM-dependent methyltransferase [Iodobacter fluviatilis]|uniref:Methyltransferase domain n=1 Tax=Iodobacter fluviatilis TaxID=537 RepID=A0A377Q4L1_9NEIS|nr:class I SAM-dependent methyltransferase [Iodobacter fluviatilis]TCU81186.1 methyltransferase family protein [Iodobacter fluviatilis]STQ90164.1 Methyltransferase domain [Iodobacter fluviatilis]
MPLSTPPNLNTQAGIAVYSPSVLKLYDMWVLWFSNRWVWQCPTRRVLLPFYHMHIGKRHLDVGVGTGFYLVNSTFSEQHEVSLLDLNEHSLHKAAQRMGPADIELFVADVMQPLTVLNERQYDSISLFYLLHCLPGNMRDKERVFEHLKQYLSEGGVLYGATILGDSVKHNCLGRKLMSFYNHKGIFGNQEDTLDNLTKGLKRHFSEVQISQHGKVALFVARSPIYVG